MESRVVLTVDSGLKPGSTAADLEGDCPAQKNTLLTLRGQGSFLGEGEGRMGHQVTLDGFYLLTLDCMCAFT